jgi:hypothetical protein
LPKNANDQKYSCEGLFPTDDDVAEMLQFMDVDTSGRIELGELITNMAVQVRTGQDRTGQDRTGQDRTGQDRTGQDRTG